MRLDLLTVLRVWWDVAALVVLVGQLPIPLFWLVVHPRVSFWRRHPRACYYGVAPSVWVLVGVALLGWRRWWLAERFTPPLPATAGWLLPVMGLALLTIDLWLLGQVKRGLGWRVLVGLPELMPKKEPAPVAASGIYARLRHPRYLGMMLAWTGAVLLTGATRLAALVAVFIGLALIITELEERELLGRLGEAYADYRRRVPRFLPRWR